MTDLDLDTVKCEVVEDHIAVVRLDNPPVNAHSPRMLAEIPTMFDRLSDLEQVRAVVLTGQGSVFCRGSGPQGASRSGLAAGRPLARQPVGPGGVPLDQGMPEASGRRHQRSGARRRPGDCGVL